MDLRYSREDEAFRTEVRAWLEKEAPAHGAPPPSDDWPARRAYDTGWQRKLHDAGLAGLAWPAELGGRGLPISQQLVYFEEYARADAPYIGVNFVGLMHAGPTLIAEGSEAQRAFHLPRILRGESVWCQGFSEPQAGSDLASLRTRASLHGDEYVVSGQKIWSTRAHVADYCELLVRTDTAAPKHKGITWLILDMRQPGVKVRPMRTIDGESHFCEVFLDEARVPIADRVGAENDGWRIANVTLRFERGTAFAQHIIKLRSQLLRLASLAMSRRTARGTAWDELRLWIGRLHASIEALWRMTQMCVTEAERSGAPSPLGSAVKLRYSELSQEISELAVRVTGRPIIGAASLDETSDVAREYLWSLQATIAAGTSQIQRNLIAQRILGMPKASDAKRRAQ
jgi:alkylation response protein AidB-like acyl-CoA dehydrogenase